MFSLRPRFALWLLPSLLALTGCNYVHFGRIEPTLNDQQLAAENTDLRVQKKMLQQELALARKEGDALRALAESSTAPTGAASQELAAKLNETSRELATLRISYSRLQDERAALKIGRRNADDSNTLAALEQVAEAKTRLADTEDKLAASLRTYTELQQETARLRSEIDVARTENARLTTQVKDITSQYKEVQAAFADLNTEFLAQKVARAQAEQDAEAIRAQMQAVMARPAAEPATLASARAASATGAREIAAPLQVANLPGDDASTARLATNPERLRALAAKAAGAPPALTAPAPTPPAPTVATVVPSTDLPAARSTRLHTVQAGETLEKIAKVYYGRADRWTVIYAANNALLSGGRPLKPGMRLDIPSE